MRRPSHVLATRVGHEMKPTRTEEKVYEDIQRFIDFILIRSRIMMQIKNG